MTIKKELGTKIGVNKVRKRTVPKRLNRNGPNLASEKPSSTSNRLIDSVSNLV